MANLSFSVTYGTTIEESRSSTSYVSVYCEDLNNCQICVDEKGSCWACLMTSQQVFNDDTLTTIVSDGYYSLIDSGELFATWYIINGFPQTAGFYNP